MRDMLMKRTIPCSAILALLMLVTFTLGCVQRTISVTSDPPGALVYLNDEEVGRTPLSVPFTYYGKYHVRLEHDGYQPLAEVRSADAPWWEAPGPDLIAEMIPNNRVEIGWHFNMNLMPPANADRVIDRASQMRALLRRETQELDTKVVTPENK